MFLSLENEETEGSEGQADMFGDAELDDDDLYSMEHDNQAGEFLSLRTTGPLVSPTGPLT